MLIKKNKNKKIGRSIRRRGLARSIWSGDKDEGNSLKCLSCSSSR